MDDNCVFCNIVNKTIRADILKETGNLVVIRDIMPKAPVHLLIVPKKHILSINHLEATDRELLADIFFAAKDAAFEHGIAESGYKLVFNVGRDGGQVIPHLHLHLLGGKKMEE